MELTHTKRKFRKVRLACRSCPNRAAVRCRRSNCGNRVGGGAGRQTEAAEQLSISGVRPPFQRRVVTFDSEYAAAWLSCPTVGFTNNNKEFAVITEHSSSSSVAESQTGFNSLSVLLPDRSAGRTKPRSEESANGWDASSTAPDRTSHTSTNSVPKLQLAGMKLADLEKLAITQTLQQCAGNRTKAARKLGISVRTLQRKLRAWSGKGRSAAHPLP